MEGCAASKSFAFVTVPESRKILQFGASRVPRRGKNLQHSCPIPNFLNRSAELLLTPKFRPS